MGNSPVVRLSLREESALVESVAELAAGGVSLPDAYREAGRALDRDASRAASAIANALDRGDPVCAAAEAVLGPIDPTHRSMLRMIDSTGESARCLERASAVLRARLRAHDRATAAMLYPAVVVAIALAAAVVAIAVLIPAAARVLSAETSPQAVLLVRRGTRVVTGLISAVAAVGITVALVATAPRRRRATPTIDRVRLALPILGELERSNGMLAFCHLLSGLLEAGESLSDALAQAAATPRNSVLRSRLCRVAAAVRDGGAASDAFASALADTPLVARWFALAEAGADVDHALVALTRVFESSVERTGARIAALAEPGLMMVAGAVVLTIVVTLVLPLFDLYAVVLS
jgi:type II secretory pathway component PulF